MRRIYQKHHGLPGIPQTTGQNGNDGDGGNNIYFGFVSNFFNNMEMTVDNFVRIAQKNSSTGDYYTGIFTTDGATDPTYTDQQDYTLNETITTSSSEITITHDETMNIFRYIYSDDYYTNYRYSYKDDEKMSWLYAKVDINQEGVPDPWNLSKDDNDAKANRWITSNSMDTSHYAYPYIDYDGTQTNSSYYFVDIMPGTASISKLGSFELFSISNNNKRYVFSDANDRYNDIRYSYTWDNDSSTIDDFIEATSLSPGSELVSIAADYVKYNSKAVETVLFTDKLMSSIKAGDVIYFYTDEDSFELDHNVEYMVVITEALEGCTLNELLAAATIVEPFSFNYIETQTFSSGSYVVSQNKAVCVYYGGTEDVSINGANMANMLSYGNDAVLAAGTMTTGTTENEMALLRTTNRKFLFKSKYDSASGSSKNVISASDDNDSKTTLKISNLFVKNDNIGNVETEGALIPSVLNVDSDGYCYTLTESDYNILTKTFTVNAENIITDTTYTDYAYGAVVMTYDNSAVSSDSVSVFGNGAGDSTVTKYVFDSDNYTITLADTYSGNTSHIIMLWASDSTGMKYYSKHTICVYNTDTNVYDITLLEDNATEEGESTGIDNTVFVCSGLSADESTTDGTLDIYVPSGVSVSIYANTQLLSEYYNYSNSWCTLSSFGSADNDDEKYAGMDRYTMSITVSDNIPQIASTDDMTNARDFYAYPGVSNETDGCDLFNALLGGTTVKTSDRSVTITVKYGSTKSYYKLTQPGFIDNRKVPEVNITINKDLYNIERSNSIDNGVLCNEFQFFVDIDINNFSRDYWGSFVPDGNITLNFDIASVSVDYDYVERYGVQSAEDMYTVHMNAVDVADFNDGTNYCVLKTQLVNNDIDDPYGTTVADLDNSNDDAIAALSTDTISTTVTDNIKNSDPYNNEATEPFGNGRKYTFLTSTMFPSTVTTDSGSTTDATRGTGLNDSVLIRMRNVSFEQANSGKFRFRVTVEYGNPVFSYLFFRYYVSNMWVSYTDNDGDVHNFYVGTSNLATTSTTGKYQTYDYMYATETFNVFVCPLSLTAIPEEDDVNNIKGTVTMTGSENQISLKLDTYVPPVSSTIASMDETTRLSYMSQNQLIPWYMFSLKKRYFQDNVKNISVQPIHIDDIGDKISKYELYNVIDKTSGDITSSTHSTSYMSAVYNANLYNSRMVDDEYQFSYNDEYLLSSKYAQYSNNSPVFIPQELTYEVRDSVLMNAIDSWNYEYQVSGSYNDSLFTGHLTTYGNGYEYLDDSYDTGQYDDILSLAETKSQNEAYIFSDSYIVNAAQLSKSSVNYPKTNDWFRALLYQLKWQYPKYYTDSSQTEYVDAYDIVDNGTYYQKVDSYDTSTGTAEINEDRKYTLPYNIMYSIYPRCAYDDENDMTIVFMLRCPSVIKENQYAMTTSDLRLSTPMTDEAYAAGQLKNSELTKI